MTKPQSGFLLKHNAQINSHIHSHKLMVNGGKSRTHDLRTSKQDFNCNSSKNDVNRGCGRPESGSGRITSSRVSTMLCGLRRPELRLDSSQ